MGGVQTAIGALLGLGLGVVGGVFAVAAIALAVTSSPTEVRIVGVPEWGLTVVTADGVALDVDGAERVGTVGQGAEVVIGWSGGVDDDGDGSPDRCRWATELVWSGGGVVPTPVRPTCPTAAHAVGVWSMPEGGRHEIGSPTADPLAYGDEKPRHEVRFGRRWAMATVEIPQSLALEVIGPPVALSPEGSLTYEGPELPAALSWCRAVQLAVRLSAVEGLDPAYPAFDYDSCKAGDPVPWDPTRSGWRLPTEAEWEATVRASGAAGDYQPSTWDSVMCAWGNALDVTRQRASGDEVTATCEDGHAAAAPVTWAATAAGEVPLRGALGNLWEWTHDGYDSAAYEKSWSTAVDPVGPHEGSSHVARGGSYLSTARLMRPSYRMTKGRNDLAGVRLVRTLP